MKYYIILIYWMINVLPSSLSQYAYRKPQANLCDGNKAELVERFFTVIFSEFRNPPPVCVCVQMCIDQATYCYPNGCLKRMEVKQKVTEERTQQDSQIIQVENKKPLFIIDTGVNQLTKVDEINTDSSQSANTETPFKKPMNVYTFSDKYRKLFKFRKLPKVQLQYNLREQVKNTKSNTRTADVANNRWPLNKLKQVNIGKPYQPDVLYDKSVGSSKHFDSLPSITPRYFKRDLKSDSNIESKKNGFVQTEEEPEKFSLDKLINDLIESSLDNSDNNNNGIKEFGTTLKDLKENEDTYLVTSTDIDFIPPKEKTSTSSDFLYDTTTSVGSLMNDTNEFLNNKSFEYEEDQISSQTHKEMFKNVYSDDMINTLSKSIEKLNNTSFEKFNERNVNIEKLTQNLTNNKSEWDKNVLFSNMSDTNEKSKKDNDTNKNLTTVINH